MASVAYVNEVPVPTVVYPAQLQSLFPTGVLGLRRVGAANASENMPVFPQPDGTLLLVQDASYYLPAVTSAAAAPSNLFQNGGATPSSKQGSAIPVRGSVGGLMIPIARHDDASSRHSIGGAHDVGAPHVHQSSGYGSYGELAGVSQNFLQHHTALPASGAADVADPGADPLRAGKMIMDRVHDHIMVPWLASRIIDTPEFQRLRYLKQLGSTMYLYPGATHTRFEHSIGVCHLAGLMAEKIARRQPELGISRKDILCVMIAGLCHDLGHGPFSHLFETVINASLKDAAAALLRQQEEEAYQQQRQQQVFSPSSTPRHTATAPPRGSALADPHMSTGAAANCVASPQRAHSAKPHSPNSPHGRATWHHEEMSAALVRRIFHSIADDATASGITQEDIEFIVLAIEGLPRGEPWPGVKVGRPAKLRCLLDIVANKRNGIDVDKLDYFMRDSQCCYGRAAVDCHISRLINSCSAIEYDGEWQICFEEKMALSLGDIFSLRAKLHKYAYQHRVSKIVDNMLRDALRAAEPYFRVRGTGGAMRTFTECVDDVEAFILLGDWIINAIAASDDPRLVPAQRILARLHSRDLYTVAGTAQYKSLKTPKPLAIADAIISAVEPEQRAAVRQALIVEYVVITYGSSDSTGEPDDPVNHVTFYNPKRGGVAGRLDPHRRNALFSPLQYMEKTLMVMSRTEDQLPTIMQAFASWRRQEAPFLDATVPGMNTPCGPRRRERETSATPPPPPLGLRLSQAGTH
jgi:HD superfamily phosphohydrolase